MARISLAQQAAELRAVADLTERIKESEKGLFESMATALKKAVPYAESVARLQQQAQISTENLAAAAKEHSRALEEQHALQTKMANVQRELAHLTAELVAREEEIKTASKEEVTALRIKLAMQKKQQAAAVRSEIALQRHIKDNLDLVEATAEARDEIAEESKKTVVTLEQQARKQRVFKALVVGTGAAVAVSAKLFKGFYDEFLSFTRDAIARDQQIRDSARDYAMSAGDQMGTALALSTKSRNMHLANNKLYKDEAAFIQDIAQAVARRGDLEMARDAKFVTMNGRMRAAMGATAAESEQVYYYFEKVAKVGVDPLVSKLYNFGRAVSVSGEKIKTELVANLEMFSKYGAKRATAAFQRMIVASKQTGLSVKSLSDAFSSFDNFEEGLESSNKLNQMFGTNISSIRMMAMDESQRMDHVVEQIKRTTGDFSSMDRWQKSYLAKSFGMNIDQLEALMKGAKYVDPAVEAGNQMRNAATSIANDNKDIAHNMKKVSEALMNNSAIQELTKSITLFVEKIVNNKNSLLNKVIDWLDSPNGVAAVAKAFQFFITAMDALIRTIGDFVASVTPNDSEAYRVGKMLGGGLGKEIMESPELFSPEGAERNRVSRMLREGSTVELKDASVEDVVRIALQALRQGKEADEIRKIVDTINVKSRGDSEVLHTLLRGRSVDTKIRGFTVKQRVFDDAAKKAVERKMLEILDTGKQKATSTGLKPLIQQFSAQKKETEQLDTLKRIAALLESGSTSQQEGTKTLVANLRELVKSKHLSAPEREHIRATLNATSIMGGGI